MVLTQVFVLLVFCVVYESFVCTFCAFLLTCLYVYTKISTHRSSIVKSVHSNRRGIRSSFLPVTRHFCALYSSIVSLGPSGSIVFCFFSEYSTKVTVFKRASGKASVMGKAASAGVGDKSNG